MILHCSLQKVFLEMITSLYRCTWWLAIFDLDFASIGNFRWDCIAHSKQKVFLKWSHHFKGALDGLQYWFRFCINGMMWLHCSISTKKQTSCFKLLWNDHNALKVHLMVFNTDSDFASVICHVIALFHIYYKTNLSCFKLLWNDHTGFKGALDGLQSLI